jgi:hypothetical protein
MITHAVVNGIYAAPIEYIHNSAKDYLTGQDGFYIVTDAADID